MGIQRKTVKAKQSCTRPIMKIVTFTLLALSCKISDALKCFKCDGLMTSGAGNDTICDVTQTTVDQVECPDKCGVLVEERLKMLWVYLNKAVMPISQTDTTWRRGCVTRTGMDLVSDLETERLPAPDTLGCVAVGERIEGEVKVTHRMCMCETDLCNNGQKSFSSISFILALLVLQTMI